MKMFYNEVKRFWNILYTFICRSFIQIISVKEKEYVALLSTVSVLKPFFQTFVFVYLTKKIIIAKLQQYYKNCFYLSDGRHFLNCIYIFKVLFLSFI